MQKYFKKPQNVLIELPFAYAYAWIHICICVCADIKRALQAREQFKASGKIVIKHVCQTSAAWRLLIAFAYALAYPTHTQIHTFDFCKRIHC